MSSHLPIRAIGPVNWIGLATLINREIRRFMGVYLQTLIAPVVTTVLFYTIFKLAFGGEGRMMESIPFLTFLAPGLIVMTMVQNAFTNTSSSLIIAKIQKNIVDMLMPPLTPLELLLGLLIGGVMRGLMIGALATIVMMVIAPITFHNIAITIIFAVLGTTLLSAVGILAGLYANKFDEIAAVTNFVITPLAFLSGTFYSIKTLPLIWQKIASFNPFFYMIDGFRAGFIGHADSNLAVGIIVLSVLNVILLSAVLWILHSGYKIKS